MGNFPINSKNNSNNSSKIKQKKIKKTNNQKKIKINKKNLKRMLYLPKKRRKKYKLHSNLTKDYLSIVESHSFSYGSFQLIPLPRDFSLYSIMPLEDTIQNLELRKYLLNILSVNM